MISTRQFDGSSAKFSPPFPFLGQTRKKASHNLPDSSFADM